MMMMMIHREYSSKRVVGEAMPAKPAEGATNSLLQKKMVIFKR